MAMEGYPSELKSSTYHRFTTYTNSFFLLRVPLMINKQLSAIGCSKGMLTLNSRYPSLGITFDSLFNDVNAVVKNYGISAITNYWIEDVPLFELKYASPDGMAKFILSAEMVQNEIASRISEQLAKASGSTSYHQYHHFPVVVHTEVFLITPDPASKDAELKLVTSKNLSTCIAIQKKSEVVNFGALFRRYNIKGPPTSQQLFEDLNGITEWFQLGIELGIPGAELKDIGDRNDDVRGRRCEMLSSWLKTTPRPTWAAIVNALASIGSRILADKMTLKYSVPVTSFRETKPVSKQVSKSVPTAQKKWDPIQQKLSSAVQELQSAIESKDMELVVNKQTATEAQNARDIVRGRLDEIGKKAVEVQTKVAALSKISSDTQYQLDFKQRNLKALQKGQGDVDRTHKEILKLQEELTAVLAELASDKEKDRSLPEQLQQAKKELAEKSERVQELESTQQKLETSLENQRERVDQLLMQKSVASDLQQHNAEMKYQLVTAKKELEAKAAEVANLKETVAYQEVEVKRLSAEVRSREALLQELLMQLSQTRPDHTQELKSKEELQRLTEEVSELRAKLYRAEDAKQEAQRQMEAAEQKSRLLQEIVRETRLTPPPVPPRQARKPTSKSELPAPGNVSWEYKIFTKNSPEIVDKLAHVMLAARVASKLSAAGIIGESVTEHVHNYGPGITERSRLQHIITALKDMIKLDARRYHDFRDILVSLGIDADKALHYLPEKDPTDLKSQIMKARTPSKDQGGLRGVDIIAETSVSVTNDPQTFHWKGYGLKLDIPPASLPAGVEQSDIKIKASLEGEFQFPENTTLVSAVFGLQCPVKFTKPLTLEIQHCGKHSGALSFVRAKCSQKDLPYQFKPLESPRGVFSSDSGAVTLFSFSGLCIVQTGSEEQRYCSRLYYFGSKMDWRVHFVVVKDLKSFITVINQNYKEKGAIEGPDQDIEFEEDRITMDIPEEGFLTSGWTITALTPPMIIKKKVDSYKGGRRIPSCQLQVKWNKDQPPVNFQKRVILHGVKKSHNFITIQSDPHPSGVGGQYGSVGMTSGGLQYHSPTNAPDLPQLLKFPGKTKSFSIAREIGIKYKQFGTFLLNDSSGATVDIIAQKHGNNSEQINIEILQLWLAGEGRDVSWRTLVCVLNDSGLGELATEIADVKKVCL